jgi:soluble lytic murein transglycosylase-like protein
MLISAIYDPLFSQHGGSIPVAYYRALAQRESSMNPGDTSGPAWGLLQITEVARNDYNARSGQPFVSRQQLLDPATNVRVASWLLRQIVNRFGTHPSRNLKTNWNNPEFVKLVTAGWNAGWVGVDRVASYLEARNISVTHDNVHRYASAAGATGHLSNSSKHAWQRSVADLYLVQPDAGRLGGLHLIAGVVIAVGLGLLVAHYS